MECRRRRFARWSPDRKIVVAGALVLVVLGCVSGVREPAGRDMGASSGGRFGVLLMAHGGSPEWDRAVLEAVESLRPKYPIQVAFGMADAATIDKGVRDLEASGVDRVGVVRLFISGESWFERTRQILGLEPGAPSRPAEDVELHEQLERQASGTDPAAHSGHDSQPQRDDSSASHQAGGHHARRFYRIETHSRFALSREGLAEAEEMDDVLIARARALSSEPANEDLLILAHGPGDDEENERWIATITDRTQGLREIFSFRRIEVMTLREDWSEKRELAEQRIRAYVQRAADEGGRALVIPYRVHGFGPYSEVLNGLDYVSDGQGLLPHYAVTEWIDRQAALLAAGSFERPAVSDESLRSERSDRLARRLETGSTRSR